MPGPRLLGILSPAPTSITQIHRWTSSRENVAVRLSPPDSMKTTSRWGWAATRSSTADSLTEMSSRMAVWGQPPVATPTTRSSGRTSARRTISASTVV